VTEWEFVNRERRATERRMPWPKQLLCRLQIKYSKLLIQIMMRGGQ